MPAPDWLTYQFDLLRAFPLCPTICVVVSLLFSSSSPILFVVFRIDNLAGPWSRPVRSLLAATLSAGIDVTKMIALEIGPPWLLGTGVDDGQK